MRDEKIAAIRQLALFAEMSDATFADLMRGAYHQDFPAQIRLIEEGRSADFLHIVTDGMVELYAGWNGKETTMDVLRPVSTFILAACINDAPYLMSARTLVPSRIVLIPGSDIRTAFALDPIFAKSIVRELASCYRSVVRHAKDLKLRASRERLANFILKQSRRCSGADQFELPLEKRLLAALLGMTPENLSRSLKALRIEGVAVDGMRVTITDRTALGRVACATDLIDGDEGKLPDRVALANP